LKNRPFRTLPSPAKVPPTGADWLHEIKHHGFRIRARRDATGVHLIISGLRASGIARATLGRRRSQEGRDQEITMLIVV